MHMSSWVPLIIFLLSLTISILLTVDYSSNYFLKNVDGESSTYDSLTTSFSFSWATTIISLFFWIFTMTIWSYSYYAFMTTIMLISLLVLGTLGAGIAAYVIPGNNNALLSLLTESYQSIILASLIISGVLFIYNLIVIVVTYNKNNLIVKEEN